MAGSRIASVGSVADEQCTYCGRSGHVAASCPMKEEHDRPSWYDAPLGWFGAMVRWALFR